MHIFPAWVELPPGIPPRRPPSFPAHLTAMDRAPLTERQNEAYQFIRSYLDEHRRPPTLKEIGNALGIASTNGVYKLLQALERKGWIEREKHRARSLRLRDEDSSSGHGQEDSPRLPIVSRTPSDEPERLRLRPQGTLSVDDRLLRKADDPADCLVGHAGDDGMNGAGIQKGDLLLIEELDWTDVDNGTLVGVLVRKQLLAREFQFANRKIHLHPADRHYTENAFPPDDPDCYVIGRLLALLRTW